MIMNLRLPPFLRFVLIGGCAAAVHLGVVRLLVESGLIAQPLLANVCGWLVAFAVSFGGHFGWTFAQHAVRWHHALPRFFLLSATGFAINEASYALALRWLPWRYDGVLALVLVAVAMLTWLLSRSWAFRDRTR